MINPKFKSSNAKYNLKIILQEKKESSCITILTYKKG